MEKDIKITSGYNFDGYIIEEYLGVYSGETALGTGFLSTLEAQVTDFFGVESDLFSGKLEKAKNAAIEKLLKKVSSLSANAIIGLDIDYNMFTNNMIGVIANGTAVKIRKNAVSIGEFESLGKDYYIKNFSVEIPIRPGILNILINKDENVFVRMEFYNYKDSNVSAINMDVKFVTIFEEEREFANISFIDIKKKRSVYTTEYVQIPVEHNEIKLIKSIHITVKKYIENGNLITDHDSHRTIEMDDAELSNIKVMYGNDAVMNFEESDTEWICVCGNKNNISGTVCSMCHRTKNSTLGLNDAKIAQIIDKAESMDRASDILNFLLEYNENLENNLLNELIAEIKEDVKMERIYGNMKKTAIKKLKKILQER